MRTLLSGGAKSLAVPVVAGALLAASATATAAAGEFELVLDSGHIDAFTMTWQDDTLGVVLQEDVTGHHVPHAPEDVLLQVKPEAAMVLPDPVPPSLSFLGDAGDTVYYLPQTQDPELIWPGWSTEQIPAGVFTNPLRIEVTDVQGPGDVFLWQTGSFGEPISVLGGGFQLPGTISPNANVHAHANWAFTETGRYTLTVRGSGTLAGGGTVTSAPVTYTFQVGDAEPAPSTTLGISGLAGHYHSGDIVTLTAVQDPPTGLDHYHWFTRVPGASEWVVVPDAGTGEYSFTATADHNGVAVIVRLYDADHAVVAESAPVTIVVDDHGEPEPPGDLAQRIVATLPEDEGALVASVDPDDAEVVMSDFELGAAADRWTSTGDLRPVTVTDTRAATPGWVVSGQVGDFTSDGGDVLGGGHLGWTPLVAEQPGGGGVTAGGSVAPGPDTGDGLSVSRPLAAAAAGDGAGTSRLGAGLLIEAPTTLVAGTYEATITFTAI
ncbi:choice-of-anchor M domain-containing protein [Jiangella alkaliphila]|uniref:Surface-anchored protein n=1 Tax=Jiangella alkaliphila TaxID=419479 RepID=A0A1H2KJH1_9ACTN|nr:choice-of-anchor M domain-containing protein [Jiangella alkaliphila]SDU68548.1 surface-anchored protein [Jiangella alkaliphila]